MSFFDIQDYDEQNFAFAGIDPGKKIVNQVALDNPNSDDKVDQIKLSSNEYYERINARNFQKQLNKKKSQNIENISEIKTINQIENGISSTKTTNLDLMYNHLLYFLQYVNIISKFYSNRNLLREKFKLRMRKNSVLDNYVNQIYTSLKYGFKVPDATSRYSNIKSKKTIIKNYLNSKRKNKFINSNKKQTIDQYYSSNKECWKEKLKKQKLYKQSIDYTKKIKNNNKISPEQFIRKQHNIQHTPSKIPVIFYGNARISNMIKGNLSTPNVKLQFQLAKKINVVQINEYLTSQVCNSCYQRSLKKMRNQNGKEINGVVHCNNAHCTINTIARDLNSAKNILNIGKYFFEYKKRHESYC